MKDELASIREALMKVQTVATSTMYKMDHGFVPDPEGETFQALKEAIGAINPTALSKIEEGMGWIPVSERLPEDKVTVWLANPKHGIAFLGCLDDFGEGWCWAKCNGCTYVENGVIVGECESDDYEVTHWMPLPTPPDTHQP